jgi:hypothetical protein
MNAANTNSAFDGHRRYTVALLARASQATASTVNRSYPCSCSSRNVIANNCASRADHPWQLAASLVALGVTYVTITDFSQYGPVPY